MKISAKNLGSLDMNGFCQRCFWITSHDKELPYQTPFAGIFSSIDSFTKNIIERYFERHGRLPEWLSGIGDVERLIRIRQRSFFAAKGGAVLTGVPDQLFQRQAKSYGIIDYKTARYTKGQDALMPMYEVQLNGYAYIAEAIGLVPVKDLYLVYFEPPVKERFGELSARHTNAEGFEMPFTPIIHRIRKDTGHIEALLDKALSIYELDAAPEGLDACGECARLDDLIRIAGGV